MNMQTRISAKGQVVLPSAARRKLGWNEGKGLDVLVHGDAITLRPTQTRKTSSAEEVFARLRKIGPQATERLSDEEIDRIVAVQAQLRYPPR